MAERKGYRREFLNWFFADELRPPGARPEEAFLDLCIRCNRCTASCPYGSIIPADLKYGLSFGTPVIEPRRMPCYLCMICPDVCPTGALLPLEKEDVSMGTAMIDESLCYAFRGILCRACVDACPFQGKAISQNGALEPVVHGGACVGCGICQKVCPPDEEAIRVVRAE